MDKMGYERGLVRYTSERALEGGQTRFLRPRLVGYAAVMLAMIGAFVVALDARPLASLDVTRDRGLFRENAAGQIENIYTLKVINKTQQPQRYRLQLDDAPEFRLQGEHTLSLKPGEILDFPVVGGLYRRTRQGRLATAGVQPARHRRPEPGGRQHQHLRFAGALRRPR
ncbi:putative iron-sulfur protein [Pseudomonas aeruginosa]|nr:putative iron-sulfur protein [Pseudomonas aeruginosa]